MLTGEVIGNTIVVRGCASCCYLKQLALLGVLESPGAAALMQIELNVDVSARPTNYRAEAF